jgi:hypothetical protein
LRLKKVQKEFKPLELESFPDHKAEVVDKETVPVLKIGCFRIGLQTAQEVLESLCKRDRTDITTTIEKMLNEVSKDTYNKYLLDQEKVEIRWIKEIEKLNPLPEVRILYFTIN